MICTKPSSSFVRGKHAFLIRKIEQLTQLVRKYGLDSFRYSTIYKGQGRYALELEDYELKKVNVYFLKLFFFDKAHYFNCFILVWVCLSHDNFDVKIGHFFTNSNAF